MKNKAWVILIVTISLAAYSKAQISPAQANVIPAAAEPTPAILNPVMINVFGAVNVPGRFALPKGSGLLDAVAVARGLNKFANPAKVTVIHKTTEKAPDSETINLKAIMAATDKDIVLRDGDTVIVKEQLVTF